MSWLKNVFKKKEGGSFLGNLMRTGASIASGGVLGTGANKIEFGQTATNAEILKDPSKAKGDYVSPLTGQQITFAGQPATQSADGTINITKPLQEVSVQSAKTDNTVNKLMELVGDQFSYLGKRATENVQVGADNKTLYVIGGAVGLLAIVLLLKNN